MADDKRLGDAPIEARFRNLMNAAMAAVDEAFNPGAKAGAERGTGIIILVFPYKDHEGRCNYISNGAERRDVAILLREQAARFEGQPELKGRA